jgi:hypothetical protein
MATIYLLLRGQDTTGTFIDSTTDTARTIAPASEFCTLLDFARFLGARLPDCIRRGRLARLRKNRKRLCAWIGRPISIPSDGRPDIPGGPYRRSL